MIRSGSQLEVYEFEKAVRLNQLPLLYGLPIKRKKKKKNQRSPEYRFRSSHRAQNKLIRLILSNFESNCKLLTLTFNNQNNFDIYDLKVCNVQLKKFLKKLKRFLKVRNLKYIYVAELQKRGAIHYHLVLDIRFIEKDKFTELWGYGFIDIEKVTNLLQTAYYVGKYITKNVRDKRSIGKRAYYASKGLKKPIIEYGSFAGWVYENIKQLNLFPIAEGSYESERNGTIKYSKYNLNELPKVYKPSG